MWEAIKYVTSALTLVAFLVAVAAYVYRKRLQTELETIKAAPPADRVRLVESTLAFFHVDTARLTQEQQFDVAVKQIEGRADRFLVSAALIALLALIAAALAVYAMKQQQAQRAGQSQLRSECSGGNAVACRLLARIFLPEHDARGRLVSSSQSDVPQAKELMHLACQIGDAEGCEDSAWIEAGWYTTPLSQNVDITARMFLWRAGDLYQKECVGLHHAVACMNAAAVLSRYPKGDPNVAEIQAAGFTQAGCLAGNAEGCRLVDTTRKSCAAMKAKAAAEGRSLGFTGNKMCRKAKAMDEVANRRRGRTVTLVADDVPHKLELGSMDATRHMYSDLFAIGLDQYVITDLRLDLTASGAICDTIVELVHGEQVVTLFSVSPPPDPVPGCESGRAALSLTNADPNFAKAVKVFLGESPEGNWRLHMTHEGSWRFKRPINLEQWSLVIGLQG